MAGTGLFVAMLLLGAQGEATLQGGPTLAPATVIEAQNEALEPMPIGNEPCAAPAASRFWFPPPHPCKPKSYQRYRANYFGNSCFDLRNSMDYPWRRYETGSCRSCAPQLSAPVEGAPLEPTPAPMSEAKRPLQRWPRLF